MGAATVAEDIGHAAKQCKAGVSEEAVKATAVDGAAGGLKMRTPATGTPLATAGRARREQKSRLYGVVTDAEDIDTWYSAK